MKMSSHLTDNPNAGPYNNYTEGYLDALVFTMEEMENVTSLSDLYSRLSFVRKRLEDE